MANLEEIKLLPGTRRSIGYYEPGHNKLLGLSLVFLVFIAAIYGGLIWYTKTVMADLDLVKKDLIANEEARSAADEKKLLKLKANLEVVQPILSNHLSSSEALAKLKKLISPQVQIDTLLIKSESGEYSFKAYASSFTAVSKQIAAFYGDESVTNVVLSKISSLPTGRIEFSATVNFNIDKVLKKNISEK